MDDKEIKRMEELADSIIFLKRPAIGAAAARECAEALKIALYEISSIKSQLKQLVEKYGGNQKP